MRISDWSSDVCSSDLWSVTSLMVMRSSSRDYRGKKGCPMRVLLIEDEPTTAKAIDTMLTTEGFNVYTTDLGEEGLHLGKLYDYDIILLDLNLPDMPGYDVLTTLRLEKLQKQVMKR